MSEEYVYVFPEPSNNLDFGESTPQNPNLQGLSGVVNKANKKNWLYLIALLSFGGGKYVQDEELNRKANTE